MKPEQRYSGTTRRKEQPGHTREKGTATARTLEKSLSERVPHFTTTWSFGAIRNLDRRGAHNGDGPVIEQRRSICSGERDE